MVRLEWLEDLRLTLWSLELGMFGQSGASWMVRGCLQFGSKRDLHEPGCEAPCRTSILREGLSIHRSAARDAAACSMHVCPFGSPKVHCFS